MITQGAMKPSYIFGVSLCVLLGGTLFSRIANGNASRPARHAEAAGYAFPLAPRKVRLMSPFVSGLAEAAVMQQIAGSLADRPDTPVSVEWTETYRHSQIRFRATYLPQQQILSCERLGHETCDYNPVRPDAIMRALRDTDDVALFANANLYSMGRIDGGGGAGR